MSAAHAHEHAHGGHGKDHVPHVLPIGVYIGTFLTLLVLTAITVAASYVNFGAWNLVIAMIIATLKAATVALIFMHLWFDHKFHSLIMGSSVLFLVIFISFTMFDTENRGRAESIEGERPADITNPFKASERQAEMMASLPPISTATAAPTVTVAPAPTPAPTLAASATAAAATPSGSALPVTSPSGAVSGSATPGPAAASTPTPGASAHLPQAPKSP
jgi:cytochrome c oxidase subunit 4